MAEYEDYDAASPGPNSCLTLEELRARIRNLVDSLAQVRDMVSVSNRSMHSTLERLDGVTNKMKAVNQQLKDNREKQEERKARIDQELDEQTGRALSQFLTEHLQPSTPRDEFILCRKIRETYPTVPRLSTRSTDTQTNYAQDVIYLL